jgi:predicted phage tail component-like protein
LITLDGYKPSYFGLKVRRAHSHPAPSTREKTIVIPGKNGVWDFGAEMDVRTFNLPLAFVEVDRIALQKRIREFVSFLFDHYGKPRDIKLIFDYEPDKYYMVRYSGQINPERLIGIGQFELPLKANDPIAKFVIPSDEIIMDSDIPIMSDLLWDTGFSNRQITSPQTFMVINNGSLVILFAFKAVGSGTDVALSANGKTMTLGTFTNKVYEVTDNYTVKVDGVTNLTSTNGVFLELMPGLNEINVTGSNLNLTISESLTYKYI